jgi:hypothetical protein
MANESALIRPVVDALLALLRAGQQQRLKRNARAAVSEAIRELLAADPDTRRAEARLAIAKAAGLLSEDVLLAEDLLARQRRPATRRAPVARNRKRKAGTASTDTDAPAEPKPRARRGRVTPAKPATKPPPRHRR